MPAKQGQAKRIDTSAAGGLVLPAGVERAAARPTLPPGVEAVEDLVLDMYEDYVEPGARMPLRVISWQILVEPWTPPKKVRGFYIPKEATQVQEIQTHVGRVLQVGKTAFTGKTESGVLLSDIDDHLTDPKQLVGQWVIYQRHTGQKLNLCRYIKDGRKLRLTKEDQKTLLILTDTEILALADDPFDYQFWFDAG